MERGDVYYRTGEKEKAVEELKSASFREENLDWSSVPDVVLAEPESQKSHYRGFSNILFAAFSIVSTAGKPVFCDSDNEEKSLAQKESRLSEVYAEGYTETDMEIEFSFSPGYPRKRRRNYG